MPILTRSNVLIVLLEYIDLHNLNGSMKQTFARGYPAFYHFISLYFILSTTIATNYVEFVSVMPALALYFCLPIIPISLPAKINTSLCIYG